MSKELDTFKDSLLHLQAAISLIPVAGGFLSTYVGSVREAKANERINKYINNVGEAISVVDEKKLDKAFLESEEFGELFLHGLEQARKTTSERRINRFANILANCALSDAKARERAFSIMDLVQRISDMDAFVLASYGSNNDICFHPKGNDELHDLVAKLANYFEMKIPTKEQVIYSVVFMDNLGLTWVNQQDLGEGEEAGKDILFKEFSSFRTPLGEEVISVIVPPDFYMEATKNILQEWPAGIVNSRYKQQNG